jgi:hypothetical protein
MNDMLGTDSYSARVDRDALIGRLHIRAGGWIAVKGGLFSCAPPLVAVAFGLRPGPGVLAPLFLVAGTFFPLGGLPGGGVSSTDATPPRDLVEGRIDLP